MMSACKELRVVVTGAASGIGYAAANALKESGAHVIGLDIAGTATPFPVVQADVADEAKVVSAMAEAASRLGGMDAVVNSAGIGRSSRLETFDLAALDDMFAVNVRGTILVAREALKYFGETGKIINVASELAYLGRAGASGYCATKGAVVALTRSWSRELAPKILVNAIVPGPIDTPLLDFSSLNPEKQALEISNPLGRIGHPGDVAQAILFLLNRNTTYITGQCLSVDGGAAMH